MFNIIYSCMKNGNDSKVVLCNGISLLQKANAQPITEGTSLIEVHSYLLTLDGGINS